MRQAYLRAVEYYLPDATLTNDELVQRFPDWTAAKIEDKTGIRSRRVVTGSQLASDLAVTAAERLFQSGVCSPAEIDFILFCTQSPDYPLPSTSCLIQERLGVPTTAGAFDFNLGCSGFVYGLSTAKGLIETGQADKVLLLTAETYTKHLDPDDISVRAVFGDGAGATLISWRDASDAESIGPFVFGTDGNGASRLILREGSLREKAEHPDTPGDKLRMNGPDIFTFTIKQVPASVAAVLAKSGKTLDDVDLFVFHQANKFMLEHLRKKIRIPEEKFVYALEDCGNTVSATIPIALRCALGEGRLHGGDLVMVVGFGVGYSWAAALLRWVA
ncbi:MAG: ketoacyl-ACP synthase III [Planctomycetaceae bacterium]|nr:ketoacyl-ACP synthase III [Planctomycetaceae bacterium]